MDLPTGDADPGDRAAGDQKGGNAGLEPPASLTPTASPMAGNFTSPEWHYIPMRLKVRHRVRVEARSS